MSKLKVQDYRRNLVLDEMFGIEVEEKLSSGFGESAVPAFQHRDVRLQQIVDLAFYLSLFVSSGNSEQSPSQRGDVV